MPPPADGARVQTSFRRVLYLRLNSQTSWSSTPMLEHLFGVQEEPRGCDTPRSHVHEPVSCTHGVQRVVAEVVLRPFHVF